MRVSQKKDPGVHAQAHRLADFRYCRRRRDDFIPAFGDHLYRRGEQFDILFRIPAKAVWGRHGKGVGRRGNQLGPDEVQHIQTLA